MACSGSSDQQESTIGNCLQDSPARSAYSVETRICPAKDGIAVSLCLVDSSKQSEMDPARPGRRQLGWVSPNTWDSRSKYGIERYYVDVVEVPKGKDSSGNSRIWETPRTPSLRSRRAPSPAPTSGSSPHHRPTCGRTVRFAEQPCSPCIRRKQEQGVKTQECRYKESQQSPSILEKRLQESATPKTLRRPVQGRSKLYPQTQTTTSQSHIPTLEVRTLPETSHDLSTDFRDVREGTITCFTPTVVGTSEKCHVVVQGQPSEGRRDSQQDMIPRLHVVHGRKTTTFGLVSPKLQRRRLTKQDDSQDPKTVSTLANGRQTNTPASSSQTRSAHVEKPVTQPPLQTTTKPETSLLRSGITCLTGGRDRWGRAVVEVYGDDQYWKSCLISSLEISLLLLYFHTITRKEIRGLGLTIVYDARKTPPHPKFTEALQLVQGQDPQAVHCVLLLMSKEKLHTHEKYPAEMEVVPSLKALHKCVDCSQLSSAMGGSLLYSHLAWLDLHQELHPFVLDLKEATSLLLEAIRKLEGVHKIDTVQDVHQCISEQRALMKNVLEDARLVALQREGGAMLARLRWESEVRSSYCEESRVVMGTVEELYNQVEEHVHVLARRSNMSLQHLHFLLQLREMESRFSKIKERFDVEGEKRLLETESVEESSGIIQEALQSYTAFLSEANEQKHQALMLVTEAESIQGPNYPETEVFHTMVSSFRSSLSDFLSQTQQCCDGLEAMVSLCHFCQRATEVAKDCLQLLEKERLQCMTEPEKRIILQRCHEKMSEFSPECFQEARAQACSLQISRAVQVWNEAWIRCQEVSRELEECLQELERAQQVSELERCSYGWCDEGVEVSTDGVSVLPQVHLRRSTLDRNEARLCRDRDSVHGTVTCFNINFKQSRKGSKMADRDPAKNSPRKTAQKPIEGSGTVGCQWFPWQSNSRRYKDSASAYTTLKPQTTPSSSPSSSSTSTCVGSQTPAFCSESQIPDPRVQPTSRDIQLTQEYQDTHPEAFQAEETISWGSDRAKSLPGCGASNNTLKLKRIMEELLLTEVDYVRSLGYILTHYVPLLDRPDVPPDLRGQRSRIFGNLEKLHAFHCGYFLQELQACQAEPLRVGRCFLRHRENFGLYALYSKNKPQSDALIQQHTFFKCKQLELRDSMDLSSYLLKPVQRVSKYSLLLQEMLGECGAEQSTEQQEIQAAAQVIRFQLRHGNDLLTMDAIRDCDVNLKEQGQLIRQDEFYVMFRKKRALRRVFLFQELILFTKTKKTYRGDDVYVYKQSFKTCDVGLTRDCGETGLCFEIWFRRRRAQDTYILQAERQDIKQAWTADLEQILWEQALKNRELRRQERMFMGVGSKTFMDIHSSEGAIQDRAVTCLPPEREMEAFLKTPNLTVSTFHKHMPLPRPESIGSGSNASTSGSQSSSSSGRGSLSPSSFHGNHVHGSIQGLYLTTDTPDDPKLCHVTDCTSGECVYNSSGVYCAASNTPVTQTAPPPAHLQVRTPVLSRQKPSVLTIIQTISSQQQVHRQLSQ